MSKISFYSTVLEITQDYLGASSTQVIDTQIENHLGKLPSELSPDDVPMLVAWAETTLSVITDDLDAPKEYARRLLEAADMHDSKDVGREKA